jgi:hypothetical protein
MNSDLQGFVDIEQKLRSLRPAPLPPALRRRILAGRTGSTFHGHRREWLALAASLLLAVGLGAMWKMGGGTPAQLAEPAGSLPPPAERGPIPALTEHVLGAREVGRWRAPNGQPYKVIQCLTTEDSPLAASPAAATLPRQRILLFAMNTQ